MQVHGGGNFWSSLASALGCAPADLIYWGKARPWALLGSKMCLCLLNMLQSCIWALRHEPQTRPAARCIPAGFNVCLLVTCM